MCFVSHYEKLIVIFLLTVSFLKQDGPNKPTAFKVEIAPKENEEDADEYIAANTEKWGIQKFSRCEAK